METGSYNKLPHYAVIGEPQNFYVWVNEDGRGSASSWLKGKAFFNEYHNLKKILKKNKDEFKKRVIKLHEENPKKNYV